MIDQLKEFGFKDLYLIDQVQLFGMLEEFGDEKVRVGLRITANKFKYQKVHPKQFQAYWAAVCKKMR